MASREHPITPHKDAYPLERRREDTLKHIEFMARLGMLDKIRPAHLANTYHGLTEFQVEAEMLKHPIEGEGK
jgi:hypothetical protein